MATLSKKAQDVLLFMEQGKIYNKLDLFSKVRNWYSVDRVIKELEGEGMISASKKEAYGHIEYMISLTPKGLAFRDHLKKIEDAFTTMTYDFPQDFQERFKNMSAMVHFNVKDDHIALTEHNYDGAGNKRIVYVYTKPNGHNVMRLWCEVHESFSCKHTEFAWTLPDVQEMVQIHIKERNKDA